MSSTGFPPPLENSSEGHAPHFYMMVPVGICLDANLDAHLCIERGALFVVRIRDSQYSKWWSALSRL